MGDRWMHACTICWALVHDEDRLAHLVWHNHAFSLWADAGKALVLAKMFELREQVR